MHSAPVVPYFRKMKNLILLLIILITFSGFSQSVDFSSIRINGEIKLITPLDHLKSQIEIDSIVSVPEEMDMSSADSLIFIGNSYFEYTVNRNICNLASIVFDEKIKTVNIGTIALDRNTTYENIKGHYPESCPELYPLKISNDPENYFTCSIPAKASDKKLLCFFLKGTLKRIDIWEQS